MPRVTVITPVYNAAAHLPQTLSSIQAQSFEDYEHVIVDDASADGTAALVERAASADPRIRLIRRDANGGPFLAANTGLRASSGEIVIVIDGDDVSLPQRIARQVAFLDAHPELEACVTYARALDATGPVHGFPLTPGSMRWALCLGCVLVHSSLCIRREAFARRGYYRELPLAQDYRLFCDLARDGVIATIPELLVQFRRHATRVSSLRLQELLAYSGEVIDDHLLAMTSRRWSQAEISCLIAVMRMQRHALVRSLQTLARWERCWRADDALTGVERRELLELVTEKRRAFVRRNLTVTPGGIVRRLGDAAGRRWRRASSKPRSAARAP